MPPKSPDHARLWSPAGIEGIELFSAHLHAHHFAKHSHPALTLGLNDEGSGSFSYRGSTRRAVAKTVNILNPGEPHTGQPTSDRGWKYRDLFLEPSSMRRALMALDHSADRPPEFSAPIVDDPDLFAALDRLFVALSTPTPRLERDSLFLQAFARLLRHASKKGTEFGRPRLESRAIRLVRDVLEARYAEEISIEDLSELSGLSPYHLIRSFHRTNGLPPHAYQKQRRLDAAKRDLHGDRPIASIALEHGFYDQSHLNRHFRRAYGVTPGAYRKAART